MRRDTGCIRAILYTLKPIAERGQPGLIGKRQGPQQHTLNDGKIAVVAPMPKAKVRIAVRANPGDLRS